MTDPHAQLFDRILDVADYLEARNVDISPAIKRRDKQEPGRREKEAAEEKMRRAMMRVFRVQKRNVRQYLERMYPNQKAMPGNPFDPSYDELAILLGEGTDEQWASVFEVWYKSILGGISLFEAQSLIGMDYTPVNTDALKFAREYVFDQLKPGVDDYSRKMLQQAIGDFVEVPGFTIGDVMNKLPFKETRAEMVAITEVTRAYAEGNMLAGKQLQKEFPDVRVIKIWWTNNDDRVCFPAWTLVTTERGDIPIQNVIIGDKVKTRAGWKSIKATNRRKYSGKMTTIKTGDTTLTATEDHPIWVSNKGWLNIGDVRTGDLVYSINDSLRKVETVRNFTLGNSQNNPAFTLQVVGFPGVSLGVPVPIVPISLKSNAEFRKKEINGVSAHASLLDIFNVQGINGKPHGLLKQRFSLKSTVASERTKLPVGISGEFTKLNPAISTSDNNRWSAAFLRTVVSIIPLFTTLINLATSLTGKILGVCRSTFHAANVISVSNSASNGKRLAASWANLIYRLRSLLTSTGTPSSAGLFSHRWGKVKFSPTVFTSPIFTGSLSLWRGKFEVFKSHWHGYNLLNKLNILYHRLFTKGIYVYDLQVEEQPEFFANGILVHNCPICGPLHGMIVDIDEEFPGGLDGPPGHVNCRCFMDTTTDITGERSREAFHHLYPDGLPGGDVAEVVKPSDQRYTNINDAREALRKRTVNNGVYANGTDVYEDDVFNFTLDETNSIINAIDKAREVSDFTFDGIYRTEHINDDALMDAVVYKGHNTIRVNQRLDINEQLATALTRGEEIGQRFVLARDFEDAVVHELGHIAMYSKGTDAINVAEMIYQDNLHVLSALSRYARTDSSEMFAEAFLNYVNNVEPAISSFTDQIVKEVLK